MLQVSSEAIPLTADENGILRISGTRVLLDSVVDLFDEGASPEEIVEQFDVLKLDDVYAVITFYLRHREEVKGHLADEERKAEEIRQRIEPRHSNRALRERLRKVKQARRGADE